MHVFSTFSALRALLAEATPEDWVVFDIDDTLVMIDHAAYQRSAIEHHYHIWRRLTDQWSLQQRHFAFQWIALTQPLCPIGAPMVQLVRHLQAAQIPCLAFTAILACDSFGIACPAAHRAEQLRRCGYHLSFQPLGSERKILQQFPLRYASYPTYADGVLLSNAGLKGPILSDLLANVNPKPRHIYCIDDNIRQIQSFQKINHPCSTIYWQRALHRPCRVDASTFEAEWLRAGTYGLEIVDRRHALSIISP